MGRKKKVVVKEFIDLAEPPVTSKDVVTETPKETSKDVELIGKKWDDILEGSESPDYSKMETESVNFDNNAPDFLTAEPDVNSDGKKERKKRVKDSIDSDPLLNGALFLTLIDVIIPLVLCGVNNYMSGTKVNPDDLQLTEKQKNQLAPLAEKVVQKYNMNIDPTAGLIIAIVGIYGMNFLALKKISKNEKNRKF